MIGGVAAVFLELAEPRVRHGVWDHSTFRTKPLARMTRTGRAAMISVYAPAAQAKRVIEKINRMHANVSGITKDGAPYSALDEELLIWVQATASYGFINAYNKFGRILSEHEIAIGFAESRATARQFRANSAPTSADEWQELYRSVEPALEASETILEFRSIVEAALPLPRPLSKLVVRAAIDLLPEGLPEKLQILGDPLSEKENKRLSRLTKIASLTPLPGAPVTLACKRMGLSSNSVRKLSIL